ncbi:MAG: MBL fold metallo-hydrolase [Nitrospirota bacterium]|nr:MBL fold metallo-hydrolase [Nitrospirota bacterium]
MDLGFQTIGNATLIAYDHGPVVVTDPWLTGAAYFGSWTLSHIIHAEQLEAVKACPYVFISHGHPDHLSLDSLAMLKNKTILVPDHVGGRIMKDLGQLGYTVVVLKDGQWTPLSQRIRVMCIADWNQDGLLLADIGGVLVLNFNDGEGNAWRSFIKNMIRGYGRSFLLKLFGYGDADMINFVDEDGCRLQPDAAKRWPVGRKAIQHCTDLLGVTDVIPFSSFHKYQRSDSVWANEYVTGLEDYASGFASPRCTLHPAFVSYDGNTDELHEIRIRPEKTPEVILNPQRFGDDWSDPLDKDDINTVCRYFRSIEHLEKVLDFITVRVGGRDHRIEFKKGDGANTGVMFEVPRHSLMQAIGYECFDDLLIGNFMRTCLFGDWPSTRLYPNFSPYVAKYADNGRAKTAEELRQYFGEYRRRAGTVHYLHAAFTSKARQLMNRFERSESSLYYAARRIKRFVQGRSIHEP